MKTKTIKLLVVSVVAGFLATVALAAVGGSFGVEWHSVDNGGGQSSAGEFTLTGAAGQPDAADSSGGPYFLQGGFMTGTIIEKSAVNSSWSQYE